MPTGDVVKFGGFYLNGTLRPRPVSPWRSDLVPSGANEIGDILYYSPGHSIEIRDTPTSDANKLQWVEVIRNNKRFLYSDRVLLVNVSWDDLNAQGLITGKEITIDGQKYLLRVMTGGSNYRNTSDQNAGGTPSTNEWDYIVVNELGLQGLPVPTNTDLDSTQNATDLNSSHNKKWNWSYVYNWCQEIYSVNSAQRAVRGYTSTRSFYTHSTSSRYPYVGWRPVLESLNSSPTVFVTSPTANQTLHENDVFNITGTTSDADVGNSVTVRYQLNAEPARAIKAFISTGATEAFSKSLTFKAGKLYDGETAVTGVLVDGVAHKLTVYATDDQGGTSPIVERTFYAVPNRAPALTVDAVTPSGIINTDAFDISGSYSDPDGNTTTVRYKINGSNPVEIAQGTSGEWSFTLPLGKLVVGENTIVIEAEDTYGAKTSKTVKLRKNEVKTSIKTGVARYKIEPPTGTAQEVMLWIQHDAKLTLDTSISMTQAAEAETYVPMALTNTATLSNGQVESEFYYNASAAKENIIVQITQTKTTANANEKITLISGVL